MHFVCVCSFRPRDSNKVAAFMYVVDVVRMRAYNYVLIRLILSIAKDSCKVDN